MEKCFQCKKEISDNEYVVNWGACSDCFDAQITKSIETDMDDLSEAKKIKKWIEAVNEEGINLTDWELKFMESITVQFERSARLSEKQIEVLERIYAQKTP